ncbi:TetR/AcrR family transcriptional regulator [Nocardia spumae]|uniref:TetR/AcrR family transcriptional regulator n=1 Tax=Nocardia spumae TaxID=2887190 RepID=UPI001D1528D7|nr:TetR family transcriptional regulator [Nocardia spumae]
MTEETVARRSDATRAAILEAARRRFAREGFGKATIRAIAADAGIDPSMVMRYYGSKDGLFDAALTVDLALPDLTTVEENALGETIVRRFLEIWETPPGSELMLALLRSSVSDDTVAQRFQRVFAEQLMPMVTAVGDPADAPRRAGLVVTQMLGLALCRYVLRLAPVVAMPRAQIVTTIGATIQRYLTSVPE